MHDKEGNPIFNTKNATVKQNHYEMKNNYLSYLKTKQNPNLGCKKWEFTVFTVRWIFSEKIF